MSGHGARERKGTVVRHHRSGSARPRGGIGTVLALVATLLLGVGCEADTTGADDAAPGTADDGADSGTPDPAKQEQQHPTRAGTTALFDESGMIRSDLEVLDEVSGRCEASLLSPENEQARRCFTNETSLALDPCFVPEDPSPELLPDPGTGTESVTDQKVRNNPVETVAVCLRDPAADGAVKVHVRDDDPSGVSENVVDPWWFVVLADGTRCVKVLGVDDLREDLHLSYRCDDGYLHGLVDEDKRIWTIHHRKAGSDELNLAWVRSAWA